MIQIHVQLFGLLLALTCAHSAQTEATSEFESLTERYWAWRQEMDPSLSQPDYQHSLYFNYTQQAYRHSREKAEEFLLELRIIDKSQLGPTDSIDYDVLLHALKTYITGYPYVKFQGLNILNGGSAKGLLKPLSRGGNNFRSVEDFLRHEDDITDYAGLIGQIHHLMQEAVDTGRTLHNISMKGVLPALEDAIPSTFKESQLWRPYLEELDENKNISPKTREELRQRAQVLLQQQVLPKLQQLKTFLVDDYLPVTRRAYGVCSWPGGEAYYAATLRWHLTTDMTPREVHELGNKEVANILKKMTTLKNHMGYTDYTVPAFLKLVKENPDNYLNTTEQVLKVYEDTIASVAPMLLEKFFVDVPNYPIKVVPEKDLGVAAAYGGDNLYVDATNPKLLPKFSHRSVCLHEAIPGHHTQKAYSEHQKRREFRKNLSASVRANIPFSFPTYTAYVEGWALYAESLGEEVKGVFRDDLELLGRHSEEMFRAVRLVVDTGLHCFNWTRQRAIDYLMSNTIEPPKDAANEVDRYISGPGQAAGYKVGELKFKELRHKAAKELGNQFNLGAFHTHILAVSEVSLPTLERIVEHWIQEQKKLSPMNMSLITNEYKRKVLSWLLKANLSSK